MARSKQLDLDLGSNAMLRIDVVELYREIRLFPDPVPASELAQPKPGEYGSGPRTLPHNQAVERLEQVVAAAVRGAATAAAETLEPIVAGLTHVLNSQAPNL